MHRREYIKYWTCLIGIATATTLVVAQGRQGSQTAVAAQGGGRQGGGREGVGPGNQKERQLVYATVPSENTDPGKGGYGAVSAVVFDARFNWRFVKRIKLWDFPAATGPEYVKGISVSPVTGMMYVSTDVRMGAWDLTTEKKVWEEQWGNECCDRANLSPDGKIIYAPAYGRRDRWHVADALTGKLIVDIPTPLSKPSHNTVVSYDGTKVYMAGSGSKSFTIGDAKTYKVLRTIEGFTGNPRVFTVMKDDSYFFCNLDNLIGFSVVDLKANKILFPRVEVPGYSLWTRDRLTGHGVPSHGILMTADEKQIWVSDSVNLPGYIHVFDISRLPEEPKKIASIKLRHPPYWITSGLDGKYIYSSSGDVIDSATRQIVGELKDEYGQEFYSEKLVEVLVDEGKVIRAGDQFGLPWTYGRRPGPTN
jgi:DNA-binding beta-propeller fold protein YncE